MPPQTFFDFDSLNFDQPLCDLDAIRRVNPQRFEMEQLTAIVHVDTENHGIVGYKDVSDHEFWARGHMPDFPLMPGVMLCEAAAQLAGYYARKYNLLGGDYLGFGGMNDVRFRAPVYPNCRLVLMARVLKVRAGRLAQFEFQGFVDRKMVFSGEMIGVPIHRDRPDGEE